MQYVFRLSGESPSLALAELRALFEIFGLNFKILKAANNLATVKSSANKNSILKLCERSAFVKRFYIANNAFWRVEKGRFLEREPQKKPAFHPTTLKPKLARALVNLARAKGGELLLDPFCGVGSALIEAAILGAKVIGADFDKKMVSHAKKNLNAYKSQYKHKNFKLIKGDATKLENLFKHNSIDAIATDPPYGRSSRIGAENIQELYKNFLNSANVVLKKGKYLAMLYPHYEKIEKLVNKKLWKITNKGELYVHGGLTRKVLVLRKK